MSMTKLLSWTVTDIEAWLWEVTPGDVTVAIYEDDGGIPDAGNMLFSTSFYADGPDTTPGTDPTAVWLGPHGLNWDLGPGTFWVAFEVHGSAANFAAPDHVPSPLTGYANYSPAQAPYWQAGLAPDWGLRVSGTQLDIVPEPASVLILGFALAGMAGGKLLRRKRSGA